MYYVLNSGLSQHLVDVVLGPIETRMIEEAPKTDEPPPPPPPKIETPPPFVPPPEVSIELPVETTQSTAIQTVTNVRPTAPPPPVAQPDRAAHRAEVRFAPAAVAARISAFVAPRR